MASNNSPPSTFPPSMGPGAQPSPTGEAPGAIAREIYEMRQTYNISVDDSALHLSYKIKDTDRKYRLPFDSIPLSSNSRWLLFGGTRRAQVSGTFMIDLIRGVENRTGRPLSQQEAEAFVFHSAKRTKYTFGGTVVAFAGGIAMAARGFKTMKFPFRKPKPLENYDAFPMRRVPILQGQYSRVMWHITRANMYVALGLILVQPFFRSMGDTAMAVGLYRDDRTRETTKAMKDGFDRIRMNRSQGRASVPAPATQSKPSSRDDSQNQDFYGNKGNESSDYYGKSSGYTGDNTFSDGTTDTGTLDDSTMRRRESQQPSPSSFGTADYNSKPGTEPSSASRRTGSSDFFFDDASPTSGNDPDGNQPQPSRFRSSWDSIRRGRAPPPQQSAQDTYNQPQSATQTPSAGWNRSRDQTSGRGVDSENSGDSFTFSRRDEDKALAKDQAQKEFDAMLERERRESGSGDYESGSNAAGTGKENPNQSGRSAWGRRGGGGL